MLSDSSQLLIAGFSMGWGPCLVYSAPLLLPYIGATRRNWQDGLRVALAFSTGRLLALAVLGGLATFVFGAINRFFPPHRSCFLHLVIALFMIGMGILIILGKGLRLHIGEMIFKRGTESIFIIGFIVGIAPCGPYVAILTYIACVAENVFIKGVLYAGVFALGTAVAPVVLGTLVGIIPQKFLKSDKLIKIFQIVCGAIIVGFGCKMIYNVIWLIL
jgi:sulfite exporter TauE/SafE